MLRLRDGNVWLGLAGCAFAVAYLWEAKQIIEPPFVQGMGPRAFPWGLGCIFFFLSAAVALTERDPMRKSGPVRVAHTTMMAGVMTAFACAYVFLLPAFGYVLASVLVFFATAVVARSAWGAAAVSAIFIVVIFYLVFDSFLGVPLPSPRILQVLNV